MFRRCWLLFSIVLQVSAQAHECPDPATPYIQCNRHSMIILETSKQTDFTKVNIGNQIEFIRDRVFPTFAWNNAQTLTVYGNVGKTAYFAQTSKLDEACVTLDTILNKVLSSGYGTVDLATTIDSIGKRAIKNGENMNVILFSDLKDPAAVEAAGTMAETYALSGVLTFTIVAFNGAPFDQNNFPTQTIYKVDTNVLSSAYPRLPQCMQEKMCGRAAPCDIGDPTAPTDNVDPTDINILPAEAYTCVSNVTTVWNDVILLFDNSQSMTADGLSLIVDVVKSQFGFLTIMKAGDQTGDQYFTRMGVMSYADTVKQIYALGTMDSDDLQNLNIPFDGNHISNPRDAINAAYIQLKQSPNKRPNARSVIVLITKTYNSLGTIDPADIANEFKGIGGILIVYDNVDQVEKADQKLKDLASPGYSFVSIEDGGTVLRDSMTSANCFCPVQTTPFTEDEITKAPIGGCFNTTGYPMNFNLAKHNCQLTGGQIVDDRTPEKSTFLQSQIGDPTKGFWIGLTWDDTHKKYYWIDGSELDTKYAPFNDNQTPSATLACVYATNGEWKRADCRISNLYLCERPPCDSEHYCTDDINN